MDHEDRTKSEDKVCVVQKYFSAVLLEVTREVPLASINPNMYVTSGIFMSPLFAFQAYRYVTIFEPTGVVSMH